MLKIHFHKGASKTCQARSGSDRLHKKVQFVAGPAAGRFMGSLQNGINPEWLSTTDGVKTLLLGYLLVGHKDTWKWAVSSKALKELWVTIISLNVSHFIQHWEVNHYYQGCSFLSAKCKKAPSNDALNKGPQENCIYCFYSSELSKGNLQDMKLVVPPLSPAP